MPVDTPSSLVDNKLAYLAACNDCADLHRYRFSISMPDFYPFSLEWFHRQEIRTSTSSMTSVPKPLKFLRPHYGTLKAYYETMTDSELKVHAI